MKKFIKSHFFIYENADKRWGITLIKRDGWYLDINFGLKFLMIWFGHKNWRI